MDPIWFHVFNEIIAVFQLLNCPTLCNLVDCSTPVLPVLHHTWSMLKLMFIEFVMPSNHLIHPTSFPFPPAFSLSNIRVFSNESALWIWWPNYWSFSFSISTSNEYSKLISFKIDCFDPLAVQGTPKNLHQPHRLKTSVLQSSAFFMVQLSHPYMATGKTTAVTTQTSVSKVMSLLLNTLSRFAIVFLPRSKHFSISWL